jgi:hypothetical protein
MTFNSVFKGLRIKMKGIRRMSGKKRKLKENVTG